MPAPFHRLTIGEFAELLDGFHFTRRVDSVHMHHTWRPDHAMFAGTDTIEAMWRYHTEHNGWSDIAQHVTIEPDGFVWTGRDWNRPPASSAGFNGNRVAGPFMLELIGDFDAGRDPFAGAQRDAAIEVIARVQLRHGLPAESLRFHNMMCAKTCPGSAVRYEDVLAAVVAKREQLAVGGAATAAGGSRAPGSGPPAFGREDTLLARLLSDASSRAARLPDDPADAEPREEGTPAADVLTYLDARGGALSAPLAAVGRNGATAAETGDGATSRAAREARGGLAPELLEALRPHVINLSEGSFRRSGTYETTAADVDAIFEEHLPRWASVTPSGDPLRLVLYAHGGLVGEADGLAIAHKHVAWWKENGAYPIYFVWETGFKDAVRSVLEAAARRIPRAGVRDLYDYTLDPVVEAGCRALGGVQVWGAMKRSAELAADPARGGGHYVARRLAEFCRALGGRRVELHAVGHSAGSIFHAHFIPAALSLGVPPFASLQLLAPAIRVDDFMHRLAPRLGAGVDRTALFTMRRSFEKRDNCAGVYHKSLLYLIYNALEPEADTPILGLEMSLVTDPQLKRLFGLGGASSAVGEVVWSASADAAGPSASRSTSHGGFDDDAATMNSVACRVLGRAAPAAAYRADGRRAAAAWGSSDQWLERFDLSGAEAPTVAGLGDAAEDGAGVGGTDLGGAPAHAPVHAPAHDPAYAPPAAPAPAGGRPASGGATRGRRLALCVGIDAYPEPDALAGCVNDATQWQAALAQRGFTVQRLTDRDATRARILAELSRLVRSAAPGDVVAFQYSGHGTQLPDLNGDEPDGSDEALVPVDFGTGAFIVDDDLRAVFDAIPSGVNVTCFMDCCHSGTVSRLLVGRADGAAPGRAATGRRARYLRATDAMIEAHRRFRSDASPAARAEGGLALGASSGGSRGLEAMREVVFAACKASEVAYENDGSGEFTRRALGVLARAAAPLSVRDFQQEVTRAFGPRPDQHPRLDCAPGAASRLLLAPLARAPVDAGEAPEGDGRSDGGVSAPDYIMSIAEGLRHYAADLDRAR